MAEGAKDSEQDKNRMILILKSHGIEMNVGGCGCCDSPWVAMKYNGELVFDGKKEARFST